MKFALVALLGFVSAEAPVWSLRSVKDHRTDAGIQKNYGVTSTEAANARPPYQSAMQLASSSSSDSEEEDHLVQTQDFGPGAAARLGAAAYTRVIPDRFSSDSDDLFMRSVYSSYAIEGEDKDHKPTGNFYLNEAQAKALCSEVLATHKGITGPALVQYLDTYWAKAWGHFDVNRTGTIPVLYANGLVRFLASDHYFQFINPK
jgi:hypothetical protein